MAKSKLRVYYDGDCHRCRRLAARSGDLDSEGRLEWRDLNTRESELAEAGVDGETARRRLHVIDETGQVHGGGAGLRLIWDAMPRRRWLARLASLPLAAWLLERAYAFVARRRVRDPEA